MRRVNGARPRFVLNSVCLGYNSGTPSALVGSRSRRRRRGDYFVSRDDAPTTYPFVILSKLSPRYGDHARHGILHVSHNQGDEVPRRAPGTKIAGCLGQVDGTGTTLGETLVRLGSPDVSSRRCTADSRHPPPEPDDAVHRAAAVPPIRGPGWHSPRRANRVLIFLAFSPNPGRARLPPSRA